MENNHKLTLYVSYYLSRFNIEGLNHLGYSSWSIAFEDIGKKLGVKPNSVKNWRDEFDPIHEHRSGWYQRPMNPSRVAVVKALEDLDENSIRQIVFEIFENRNKADIENLLNLVEEDKPEYKTQGKFILRGPTGRKAEIFFQKYHKDFGRPFPGELVDTRDLGCGYDFEIHATAKKCFVEVKGLSEISGGILFTNKEWNTAQEKGDDYFLVIVKSLTSMPQVSIIQNPVTKMNAKRNVYTTVQVQWSVSEKELSNSL